jgi:DNA replication and repair protein RecF
MLLQKLVLNRFRNCERGVFEFNPRLSVIVGENAQGKTNLLEAIYFVIHGTGFRESREEELIQVGETTSTVEGRFLDGKHTFDFKVQLIKKNSVTEKTYFIQKAKKRHLQYVQQQTKAVLFAPEQIEIITGSPDIRRGYFNKIISQYDPEYKKRVLNLESALRRRNKILEHSRDATKLQEELGFWNTYIIEQSSFITRRREEYITFLNSHRRLDHKEFEVRYHKNEATIDRFEEVFEKEKHIRKTLIGPQKDEFSFLVKLPFEKNVQHYGSRSEQRMTVFWLKINELLYCEEILERKPVVLLDDVFSEFDKANKKLILSLIQSYQTVLTTTEEEVLDSIKAPYNLIKV